MAPATDLPLGTLEALRHALHQHPETAHTEAQSAQRIAAFLAQYPPDELLTGVGGHGLLATYRGAAPGPEVLIRADFDALPIEEANPELPYRSVHPGRAHLCGHDGHTTIVCAVASHLARRRPARGTVRLLYQPAEEVGEGAQRMLDDPRLSALAPDWAFALHNLPGRPRHEISCRAGTFAAASVGLEARLTGHTSHAAFPDEARAPTATLGHLLLRLPQLAQETALVHGFALTTLVGAHLGAEEARYGTTPGEAWLSATLRSYSDAGLDALQAATLELLAQSARSAGLLLATRWIEPFPASVNTQAGADAVASVATQLGLTYTPMEEPVRWSEDFGYFLRRAGQGAMFGIGSGEDHPPLHHPGYDFPDALIPTGAHLFLGLIDQILGADN